VVKRGTPAVMICSNSFIPLGQSQARALGDADLPIAVIPHPFGMRSREEVRAIAEKCAADVIQLVSGMPK